MNTFTENIEQLTQENQYFRHVLFTSTYCQLVVMSLLPNEEIGLETHPTTDQFFRIESGQGTIVINGVSKKVKDGDAIVVPANAKHNLINDSDTNPLKLYTIYSPPHHKDATIHKTKQDAQKDTTDHLDH